MRKLLCILNDSLKTLVEKGEIKERYYNPGNYFDEVHFITRCETDVDYEEIQIAVGTANGTINTIPRESIWPLNNNPFFNKYKKLVVDIAKKLRPDVIRAYDPLFSGYLAVIIGKVLKVPVVISVHTDMDDMRKHYRFVYRRFLKYCKSYLISRRLERFALSRADCVIGVYSIAIEYAKRYGAKKTLLIYNKVPVERFSPRKKTMSVPPVLIYVGNFIPGKNQETLIKAMTSLDAKLVLIGKGPERAKCIRLAQELCLNDKIEFIESVPNTMLHEYYQSADIFVSASTYGETAIPVLEAMACGLPCVVAKPLFTETRDLIEGIALTPHNDYLSIAEAIRTLIADKNLRDEMGRKGRELMVRYSSDKMEKAEIECYQSIINVSHNSLKGMVKS